MEWLYLRQGLAELPAERRETYLARARNYLVAAEECLSRGEVPRLMANHQSNLDIPILFAALSRYNFRFLAKESLFAIPLFGPAMTLLPGDVVLTGAPAGGDALVPGDEIRVEIEAVGVLINGVRAEDDTAGRPAIQ